MSDVVKNIEEDLKLLGDYTISCMPVARQIGFVQDVRALVMEVNQLRDVLRGIHTPLHVGMSVKIDPGTGMAKEISEALKNETSP